MRHYFAFKRWLDCPRSCARYLALNAAHLALWWLFVVIVQPPPKTVEAVMLMTKKLQLKTGVVNIQYVYAQGQLPCIS